MSIKQKMACGVAQGSLMSPILFAIYLGETFKSVEENINNTLAASFTNDSGFLLIASFMSEFVEKLLETGNLVIEWGMNDLLQFNNERIEAVLFTNKQKIITEIWKRKIQIGGNSF